MPIVIDVKLPCNFKQEREWVVACCPALDVYSQGRDMGHAKSALAEALHTFIESCISRGVLDAVLKDCGFTEIADFEQELGEDWVNVSVPFGRPKGADCHA